MTHSRTSARRRPIRVLLVVAAAGLGSVASGYGQQGASLPPPSVLGPVQPNVYGPGVNADAAGRPYHYETEPGETVREVPVHEDHYGPGVSMDQYGRPVFARPGAGK